MVPYDLYLHVHSVPMILYFLFLFPFSPLKDSSAVMVLCAHYNIFSISFAQSRLLIYVCVWFLRIYIFPVFKHNFPRAQILSMSFVCSCSYTQNSQSENAVKSIFFLYLCCEFSMFIYRKSYVLLCCVNKICFHRIESKYLFCVCLISK